MEYKIMGYNLGNESVTISNSDETPLIDITTSNNEWITKIYNLPIKGAYNTPMSINYTLDNVTKTINLYEGSAIVSLEGTSTVFQLTYTHKGTVVCDLRSINGATKSCSLNSLVYIPGIRTRIQYNDSGNIYQLLYEGEN